MMVFAGGVLVGCVVGLAAGALLQRRTGRSNLMEGRGFATAIAMVALVVAAIALANSGHHHDRTVAAAPTTSPATTSPATTTSTPTGSIAGESTSSTAAAPGGLVSVPDVEHLARADAIRILEAAGLKVSFESLPVAANVPVGYVLSQAPLPAAMAPAGSTVALVVSAAT